MDQDNAIDINQPNNHELETSKNTSLPQKSIDKVVKNFMKCIGTLVQHVENAISHSHGIIVTNSQTIVSNDGNEIDIEEHSIKQESDDTKKNLKNVKKCILKLCLLCIEKNIFIECDIKFTEIDFYSCLDESTRSLVLEYLTENVAYTIDHIRFIIEMFNEEKGKNEAKDIRKSLIKLYKQILLIPLNSNLDETPPDFKNLNTSQWYSEARNNLADKLILLRTSLIKLRKTLKKKIPDPEIITIEDTDASNDGAKRNNNTEDEQPKKKLKLDQHVFQIPKSPDKNNKSIILSDSDSNKSKKKKRKNKESDTESVETKNEQKEVINNEISNSDSEVITELLFDESDKEVKNNFKGTIKQIGKSSDTSNSPKRKKTELLFDTELKNNFKEIITQNAIPSDTNHSPKRKKTELLFDETDKEVKNNFKQTSDKNNSPKRKRTDSESSSKENKLSLNNSQEQPNSVNKFRSISESSDLNIENLFTSQLSVSEESISFPQSKKQIIKKEKKKINAEKRKTTTKKKSKPEKGLTQLTLDNIVKNLKSTRKKEPKSPGDNDIDLNISHGIFSGLNSGDLEAEILEEHDKLLQKIISENELDDESKFLNLQQLLSEAKDEELSEEMKQILYNLRIKINWKVPDSHKIERSIAIGPSPEEQEELDKLNVTDKKYNQEEDEIIKRNWKDFCLTHHLDQDPKPFLSVQHGPKGFLTKKQRIKFGQYLAKDLPHRALHSVFRRFRLICRPVKQGRFSADEDKLILTYCSHVDATQKRFSDLSIILRRTICSVERRYRILTNPLLGTKVKWTLQLDTEVVKNLLKLTNKKNVQDLQEVKIPKEYWRKIGEAMGIEHNKIEIHYLRHIYPRLFSPNVLHSGKIKTELVNLLIKTGETDWKNVNWSEITKHFSGVTKTFLLGQIFTAVHSFVPNEYVKDLTMSLKYLKEHIKTREGLGMQPFSNRIMKRYCMTDNGLEQIN